MVETFEILFGHGDDDIFEARAFLRRRLSFDGLFAFCGDVCKGLVLLEGWHRGT